MIHITFKKNDLNQWVSYELTGHANYDESGLDIVCAAVSTLAINTCNSIEKIAEFEPITDNEEEFGGYLYVELLADLTDEQQHIAQILLESLYLGLQSIETEYPDYVKVVIFE